MADRPIRLKNGSSLSRREIEQEIEGGLRSVKLRKDFEAKNQTSILARAKQRRLEQGLSGGPAGSAMGDTIPKRVSRGGSFPTSKGSMFYGKGEAGFPGQPTSRRRLLLHEESASEQLSRILEQERQGRVRKFQMAK